MNNQPKGKQVFAAAGALLTWFAVIFQAYLMFLGRLTGLGEMLIRFFSFFTILVNVLAAVCFTSLLAGPGSAARRFFSRPSILTAICTYIVIVGIVYNTILRSLWSPRGWQQLVDELLHSVNPLLFLLFWIFFVPKAGLARKAVLGWLIFPVAYAVIVLLRGAFSGYYPYPFLNVTILGYPKVFLHTILLILFFFVISLLLVSMGKWRKGQ